MPFGIAAGIYVVRVPLDLLGDASIRFLSDVLVGVPSIVIGYFGYVTMVEWLGWGFFRRRRVHHPGDHLPALYLPDHRARAREVPETLREAGYALGAGDRAGDPAHHACRPRCPAF